MANLDVRKSRTARHRRIRARVIGTADKPRLCVFRSLNHIYVQVIDDAAGHTIAAASTLSSEAKESTDKDAKLVVAQKVGALIGKMAQEKGVKQVVFDRGGYKYHGRVKALADGARTAGLKF